MLSEQDATQSHLPLACFSDITYLQSVASLEREEQICLEEGDVIIESHPAPFSWRSYYYSYFIQGELTVVQGKLYHALLALPLSA